MKVTLPLSAVVFLLGTALYLHAIPMMGEEATGLKEGGFKALPAEEHPKRLVGDAATTTADSERLQLPCTIS